MKIGKHFQIFGEPNNPASRNNSYSDEVKEIFNLSGVSSIARQKLLQFSTNGVDNLSPNTLIIKNDSALIPVSKQGSGSFDVPVIKMNKVNTETKSAFNFFVKEIGECLSNIELALDCYNVSSLQYSTKTLKNLFFEMKIPVILNLAEKMEGLAKENKFTEINELFREVKKIIGRLVKEKNQN